MDDMNREEQNIFTAIDCQAAKTSMIVQRMPEPFIGCVIPAYNEADNLVSLIPLLCVQLAQLSPKYEILIVDDGSQDNTAEVAIKLAADYPVRLLQFARNFGKENALTAGLDHTRGDLVILMDADFQHPLDVLPQFFAYWLQGFDMVYGIRKGSGNEGVWRRYFSGLFYALMARSVNKVPLEANAGDFRLLDRKVVEVLNALPERSRYMKGLYAWVGFKTIGIPFQVEHRRAGTSGFNLWRLSELALTGITSFTSLPLRLSSAVGTLIAILSVLFGLYILLKTLIFGVDLPGWATLAVGISFLSGIQLLSIGVLGEYVARIFIEVKQRPSYVVDRVHDYATSVLQNKGN